MPNQPSPPTTIDDYIAQQPEPVRPILRQLRALIQAAAPQAQERISYGMPAYYQNGFLVSFAAWKNHIGFYPRTAEMEQTLKTELSAYKGTKGSIHFPLSQPLPQTLITQLVHLQLTHNTRTSADESS